MISGDSAHHDVVVAGAGPAGLACALRLRRGGRDVLVVERARFPRPKICGGGLTGRVAEALRVLGLARRVPAIGAVCGEVRFGRFRRTVALRRPVEVVRRDEFDADLLAQARAAGIEVHEGEALTGFEVAGGSVAVQTDAGAYRARVLVGADGAGSLVRRRVVDARAAPVRLLQVEVPAPGLPTDTIVFDFTPMRAGLRGYAWFFPMPGRQFNVGLLHHPGADHESLDLDALLRRTLTEHGVVALQPPRAWPVWSYDSTQRAAIPHVLLAGDALGVNPLSGEGISPALWQGILAADAALDALQRRDFGFGGYALAVRRATVGRELNVDRRLAGMLYGAGGVTRWLPLLLFDDEMLELYAARVAGVTVLADEKPKLLKALVRHRFMLSRWRRRLDQET
ncbi:MAG: geranylgeranyl reductase family protein [Deltaproteobacteria bacterium]|nr:geranylgeranyl reductase family protein [Deltaproteobacteria bacterium]